jgi:hypothetical protein
MEFLSLPFMQSIKPLVLLHILVARNMHKSYNNYFEIFSKKNMKREDFNAKCVIRCLALAPICKFLFLARRVYESILLAFRYLHLANEVGFVRGGPFNHDAHTILVRV